MTSTAPTIDLTGDRTRDSDPAAWAALFTRKADAVAFARRCGLYPLAGPELAAHPVHTRRWVVAAAPINEPGRGTDRHRYLLTESGAWTIRCTGTCALGTLPHRVCRGHALNAEENRKYTLGEWGHRTRVVPVPASTHRRANGELVKPSGTVYTWQCLCGAGTLLSTATSNRAAARKGAEAHRDEHGQA
jgi:hypothetical protein